MAEPANIDNAEHGDGSREETEYVRREMLYETAKNAIEGARSIDDVKMNIDRIIKGMEEELNCTVKKDDVERVTGLYDETVELLQTIQDDIIETAPQSVIGEEQLFDDIKEKNSLKYYFYEKFKSPELIAKFSHDKVPEQEDNAVTAAVTAAAAAAADAAARVALLPAAPAAVPAADIPKFCKDLTYAYSKTFTPNITLRAAANRVLSRAAIQAQALFNQYSSILNIYNTIVDKSDEINAKITEVGETDKMAAGGDKFQISPPRTLVSALSSYLYAQVGIFRHLAKLELDTIRRKITTYNNAAGANAGANAGADRVTELGDLTDQQITRINNSINMDLTYILYVARNTQSLPHLNLFKDLFGSIPPNITKISSIQYTNYDILLNPNVAQAIWDVQNSLDPRTVYVSPGPQQMLVAGGQDRFLFPIALDTNVAALGVALAAGAAANEDTLEREFNEYSIYNTEALFEISNAVSITAGAPAFAGGGDSDTILQLYTAQAVIVHGQLHAAAFAEAAPLAVLVAAAAGPAAAAAATAALEAGLPGTNKYCIPAPAAAGALRVAPAAAPAAAAAAAPQNLNPYANHAAAAAGAAAAAAPAPAFADRNLINNVIENFILFHINQPLSTVPAGPLLEVKYPLDINGPTPASLETIKADILKLKGEFSASNIDDPIKALQNIREWANWIYSFYGIKETLEDEGEKQVEKGFLIERIKKIKLLIKRTYFLLSDLLDIKVKRELCDVKKVKFEEAKEEAVKTKQASNRQKEEKLATQQARLAASFKEKAKANTRRRSGSVNQKKIEASLISTFESRHPGQKEKLEKFRLLKRYTELFLEDLNKIKNAILKYSVALVKPGNTNIFGKDEEIPKLGTFEGRSSTSRDIFESSDFVTTDESYKSIETTKPTTIFSLNNIIIESDRVGEVSAEIKSIHKLINEIIRLSNNPKVNNTFLDLQKMSTGVTLNQDTRILNAFYSFYSEVMNFVQIYNNLTNINHPGIIKQWLSLQEPRVLQDKLASKVTEIVAVPIQYPTRPAGAPLGFPANKWDWINRSCGHILQNISSYDNCFKSALALHNIPAAAAAAAAAATAAYDEVYQLYLKYEDYPLARNTISGSRNRIAIDSMALSQIAAHDYYDIARNYYNKCLNASPINLPRFYSSVYIYAAAAAARAANLTPGDILGGAAAAAPAAPAAPVDAAARNAANEIIATANNKRVAGAVNIPDVTAPAPGAGAPPAVLEPILELVNSIANGTEESLRAAAARAPGAAAVALAGGPPADYAARAALPAALAGAAGAPAAIAGAVGPEAAPLNAILEAGQIIQRIVAEGAAAAGPQFSRLLSLKRDGELNPVLGDNKFLLRSILDILSQELNELLVFNIMEVRHPYRPGYLTNVDAEGIVANPAAAPAAAAAAVAPGGAAVAPAEAAAAAAVAAAAPAAIPAPAGAVAVIAIAAAGAEAAFVAFEAAAEGAIPAAAGALALVANNNPINFLGVFNEDLHRDLNTLRRLGVFEPFNTQQGTLVDLTFWNAAPVAPGLGVGGAAAAAGVAAGPVADPLLNQRLITECCAYLQKFPEILPPTPLLYIVDQKASCVSRAAVAAAANTGEAFAENLFNNIIDEKANIGIQMMRLPFLHMIRECNRNNIYTQAAANTMYHYATIAGGDIIATNCLLIIHQVLNSLVIEYSNRFYASFETLSVANGDAKEIHERALKLVSKDTIKKSKFNTKLIPEVQKTDYTKYVEECMKSLKNNNKLCNIIYSTPAHETLAGLLLEGFDELPKPQQPDMDRIYPPANGPAAAARKPAPAAGAAAEIVLERAPHRAVAGAIDVNNIPKGVIHYIKLAIPKVKEKLDAQLKNYCKSVKDLYNSIDIMKETRVFSLINSIFNYDIIGDRRPSKPQTKAEELIAAALIGEEADVTAAVAHYSGNTGLPKKLQSIARAISGYWEILQKNTEQPLKKKGQDTYNRFLPPNLLLRSDPRMCLLNPPAAAPAPAPAATERADYNMKDSVYNRLVYNLEYVKPVDEDKRTTLTPGLGFSAKTTLAAAAVIHLKQDVDDFTISCSSLVSSEEEDKPFNPAPPAAAGAAPPAGNLDGVINSRKIQLAILCARIKGIEEIEKGKPRLPVNVLKWKALVNNVKNVLNDENRAAFTALKAIAAFTLDSYDTEKKFSTTAQEKANLYTLNHPDLAGSDGPAPAGGGGAAPGRIMEHNISVLKLSYMIAEGCKRMHYYYDAALGLNKEIARVVGDNAEYKKAMPLNKDSSYDIYNSKNVLEILCGRMSENPEDIPGLTEYKLRIKDLESVEKKLRREGEEVSDSFQRFLEA